MLPISRHCHGLSTPLITQHKYLYLNKNIVGDRKSGGDEVRDISGMPRQCQGGERGAPRKKAPNVLGKHVSRGYSPRYYT